MCAICENPAFPNTKYEVKKEDIPPFNSDDGLAHIFNYLEGLTRCLDSVERGISLVEEKLEPILTPSAKSPDETPSRAFVARSDLARRLEGMEIRTERLAAMLYGIETRIDL